MTHFVNGQFEISELALTQQRGGVGTHPHRGLEAVTVVYEGGLDYRGSTDIGGLIGPGCSG